MATLETRVYSTSFSGLGTQCILSGCIIVISVALFEWMRRKKSMRYLLLARCDIENNPTPELPPGLLSWVLPALRRDEKWYIENSGIDSAVYLRQMKMCLQFMIVMLCTVVPITGFINVLNSADDWHQITRFSLSDLDSNRWIAGPVCCMWIMSITWMTMVYRNYHWFVARRRDHFIQKVSEGSISSRTVMVNYIPKQMQDEKVLERYFIGLGFGTVEKVTLVRDVSRLQRKLTRREEALSNLEKCHLDLSLGVLRQVKMHDDLLKVKSNLSWLKKLFTRSQPPQHDNTFGDVEDGTAHDEKTIYDAIHKYRASFESNKEKDSFQSNSTRHTSMEENNEKSNKDGGMTSDTTKVMSSSSKHRNSQSNASGLSESSSSETNLWDTLLSLPRTTLDRYQPVRRLTAVFQRERVASIDYWLKKYNFVDMRVAKLRRMNSRRSDVYPSKNTAFVTFTTHTAAQLCAQGIMHSRPHTCITSMAPEPRDILWDNLGLTRKARTIRYFAVNLIVWGLTIFWLFPTGIILSLTSYDTLTRHVPFLKGLFSQSQAVRNFVQLILPVILVTGLLALLPLVIMSISKFQKFESYSQMEKVVANRYYVFSIVNVFIFFLLGYTFLNTIFGALQSPQSILDLVGSSLPAGATFFIGWVIFQISMHALELIVLGSQLWSHVFLANRFFAPTPGLLHKIKQPWAFMYYYYLPNHLLVLSVVMVYAVINPLIVIAGFVYFALGLLVFKHQFAYVYVRRYESGGALYRRVATYSTDALLISQITLWGLAWIKKELAAGIVVIPLVIMTGFYKYYLRITFYKRSKYLAADTALVLESQSNVPSPQRRDNDLDDVIMDERVGREREKIGERMSNRQQSVSSTRGWTLRRILQGPEDGFAPGVAPPRFFKTQFVMSPKSKSDPVLSKFPRSDIEGESDLIISGTKEEKDGGNKDQSDSLDGKGKVEMSPVSISFDNLQLESPTMDKNDPKVNFQTNECTLSSFPGDVGKEKTRKLPPSQLSEKETRFHRVNDPKSRFYHLPSRILVNDNTSPLQTYENPALAHPLHRRMWLPRDPFRHTDEEEWNVEVGRALVSSTGGQGVVGWWGGGWRGSRRRGGASSRSGTNITGNDTAVPTGVDTNAEEVKNHDNAIGDHSEMQDGTIRSSLNILTLPPRSMVKDYSEDRLTPGCSGAANTALSIPFHIGKLPITRYTINTAKNLLVPSSVRSQYQRDYVAPRSILSHASRYTSRDSESTTMGSGFFRGALGLLQDRRRSHEKDNTVGSGMSLPSGNVVGGMTTDPEEMVTDTDMGPMTEKSGPSIMGSPLSIVPVSDNFLDAPFIIPELQLNPSGSGSRRGSAMTNVSSIPSVETPRSRSRLRLNTAANLGASLKNRDRTPSFASKLNFFGHSNGGGDERGGTVGDVDEEGEIDGEEAIEQEVEAEEQLESPINSGDEAGDEDDDDHEDVQ